MSHVQDAVGHFRGEQGYNCAQAVLQAFASHTDIEQSCVEQFRRHGGGRAPAGECGALFAAKSMLADDNQCRQLESQFVSIAGSTRCREIRKSKQLSCQQCVEQAATKLVELLADGHSLQTPCQC